MKITHHFLARLQKEKLRGALVFTSSPAGLMPCPFSVMYGATKAFLTAFATSLAPEVAVDGIDVMVVHPSPTTSNFYNSAHKLDALEMFRKTGTSPSCIANAMLRSIGRTSVCDQGYYSFSVRILLKVREPVMGSSLIVGVCCRVEF